jgi:urease beta subunit
MAEGLAPGDVVTPEGTVTTNEGRDRRTITVTSRSDRPIRISSHYPFWRVNTRLEFDRDAARGFRLDLPSGASLRWGPGESRDVTLVALPADG